MYKEVLVFHVVRGFEQLITDTSNTAVLPATTGFAAYNGTSVSTTTPTATYTPHNAVGDSTGTFSGSMEVLAQQKVLYCLVEQPQQLLVVVGML